MHFGPVAEYHVHFIASIAAWQLQHSLMARKVVPSHELLRSDIGSVSFASPIRTGSLPSLPVHLRVSGVWDGGHGKLLVSFRCQSDEVVRTTESNGRHSLVGPKVYECCNRLMKRYQYT